MLNNAELLAYLGRQPHGRASLKQMLRELHIKSHERRLLRSQLNDLVRTRRIVQTRHHFELAPSPSARRVAKTAPVQALAADEVRGRISIHRDGFGFVLPWRESPGPAADKAADIFIPPPFLGNAMHGDTVVTKVLRRGGTPGELRLEGKVVRILQRAHATVVGEFHYARPFNFVRPFDDRLREPILIPRGAEMPPDLSLADLHRTLGSESKAARQRFASAAEPLEGAVVDVEISSYPSATGEARGRVIEVLGYRDDFGVDVEIVIRKHHLPHRFPPEVLDQAANLSAGARLREGERAPALSDIEGREDFRSLSIVTIDGETAKDFDDAVLVTRLADGYELQVHIADVSHYVLPESPIDREARLRGTSVYFPDRAIPMLPAVLSNDLCSLRPALDRLVLSCIMRLDDDANLVSYRFARGVIRSAARMTYTQVNAVLSDDPGARRQFQALAPHFELMRELEQKLQLKRFRRGSIDFDLPEAVISFDEGGGMASIGKAERNIAHRIIEEFMLAANETVASHLEGLAIPSVYRIHEKPDVKKVLDFEELAASFGYSFGLGALPIKQVRQRVNGRVRVLEMPSGDDLHITPRHYQKLVARIAGKPEERILSFLMLRSLQQARYSETNTGHFALAAPTYTHFTSPIRRYPDLLVHRLLKHAMEAFPEQEFPASPRRPSRQRKAAIAAVSELIPASELRLVTAENSDAERRADEAERELMEWKKVRFMETRMGERFPALIIHVTKNGFFVELMELFIEGFVSGNALQELDRFFYNEASREWAGKRSGRRFRLGGQLHVQVERIDPIRHKISFVPEWP